MATVRIYSDESYCNKNTFRILTITWGPPSYCEMLNSEISEIVKNNQKILGADFREFHANKLTNKNWKKMSPIYGEILAAVFHHIRERHIGLHIVIISRDRFVGNAGWLTGTVEKAIKNRTSAFGQLFASFQETDLPAVYYRVNQLFPLFKYRDKYGAAGDEFEYYPDSIGKTLNYKSANFLMSGTLPISLPLPYLDIIRMLGDAYMKSFSAVAMKFNFDGWPIIEQHLAKFEPTDSANSYLVQACDIVSNFVLCHMRHTAGLTDPKYQLKSSVIEQYLNIAAVNSHIRSSFSVDGTDIICTNQDLWANINAIFPAQ